MADPGELTSALNVALNVGWVEERNPTLMSFCWVTKSLISYLWLGTDRITEDFF